MTGTELLREIYETRTVTDSAGGKHKLHSEVTRDEAELIARVIRTHRLNRTLEIGCAYGLSALAVCDAISAAPNPSHTIIDPGQHTEWHGIGVANLRRAGYDFFRLIEEPSELALPQLLREGRTFQLVVIDGFHTFDQTLLDFYFSARLLDDGGFILLDDLHLPGIRKAARYIAKQPNIEVADVAAPAKFRPSWRRRLAESGLRLVARLLPRSMSEEVFDDTLYHHDVDLGLTSMMIAFRKTSPDRRDSHWFQPF